MANLSDSEKRKVVSEAYPGDIWKNKVKKMKDAQVARIYWRLETLNKNGK